MYLLKLMQCTKSDNKFQNILRHISRLLKVRRQKEDLPFKLSETISITKNHCNKTLKLSYPFHTISYCIRTILNVDHNAKFAEYTLFKNRLLFKNYNKYILCDMLILK